MSQHTSGGYRQLDHHDNASEQLDYDGHATQSQNPSMPRLRGGDASYDPNGGMNDNGRSARTTQGEGYGRLPPAVANGVVDEDLFEVPSTDFYAAQGSRRNRHPQGTGPAPRAIKNRGAFDFNNAQQPNPWHGAQPQQRRVPERQRVLSPEFEPNVEVEVRCFAECHDRDLRAYLAARSISFGFLTEIDQFIRGHPEISTCAEGRATLREISVLPPLKAYKYFLKGYTRPARYIDGIIRTDAFTIPLDLTYQSLSTKNDPELVDFFDGFDFRHDIIERIDKEVYMGMQDLGNGRQVPLAVRKLICYAVWGNPVDAYKWFEYAYQNEYMPHRYLPEHVVLRHVPKPVNYTEPRASVLTGHRKHGDVRARMARANDQGVDVLEVLIAEYRLALIRRAHRRFEIDDLVARAKQRLERERQDPTGVDIVDFIMDDAVSRQGTNRRREFRPSNPRNRKTYNLGPHNVSLNGVRINGGNHTFTRANERRGHGFLQAQAAELRHARTTLVRLYTQEQHAFYNSRGASARQSSLQMVQASRASAERRYVNCLIRYCRDANQMSAQQATQLQKHFTRERMGDLGVSHSDYLLSMYPRELNY
ncbi:hypothetical protein HBH98_010520 [Parastagonospora nodorum]|nr:hypothetical protein HBI10_005140 [Parastagonospora nodorum]KAH4023355.1 hypothetical protein HBI13_086850 [Parastagonospora nodorum]KAH4041051.1 hypothetical protein HBI09_017380 [Parastagonospora nodorum]KAH4069053.1 hypothetical protein HBH50_108130 [Parastagonospora nodorum]KAH4088121.1 hypothetical protein HBH48_125090 [Parastagonospora nodorum]